MEKRTTGAIFCLAASILFSARYLAAAMFMSNVSEWGSDVFAAGLEYVGSALLIAAAISLLVGIGYLVRAEMEEKK